MALQDIVYQAVKENGGRTAVIFDHECHDISDDSRACTSITYQEMWKKVEEIKTAFDNFLKQDQIVGVLLKPSCDLPSILMSILSSRCAFWPLSSDGLKYSVNSWRRVQASWILIQSAHEKAILTALDQSEVEILTNDILLKYNLKLIRLIDAPLVCLPSQVGALAYCITTSGTTSSPKVVKVPHSCIVPNVLSIRNIFDVRCTDKFLLCSPLTFDPSMIDIFVSLSCGAALLIVPDEVKKNPANLLNVIHNRQAVTVLQATPSLIGQFSPQKLRKTILGADTSLRLLALGGEQFPTGIEMSKWRDPANRTQFFNLYGITEVSCWASYEQVNVKRIIEHNEPVPIGKALDKTMVKISPNSPSISDHGNILIGSAERVCVIDDGGITDHTAIPVAHSVLDSDNGNMKGDHASNQKVIWRNTGDCGKLMPDGSILYIGRQDDQVKRNGKRLNISVLEQVCRQIRGLSDCRVLLNEENSLVIFIIVADDQMPVSPYVQQSEEQKSISIGKTESDTIKKHDRLNANSMPPAGETRDRITVNDMDSLKNDRKRIPGDIENPPTENSETKWSILKEDLIKHIKNSLPSHYMPDVFIEVNEAFPVTAHGKLDKKSLLKMANVIEKDTKLLFKSPQAWALKLWLVHLPEGVEEIKADDNFLSLGGDSIAAVRLNNTLKGVIKDATAEFLELLFNKSFQQFVETLESCLHHDLSSEASKGELSSLNKTAELHSHVENDKMISGNRSSFSKVIIDEMNDKKKQEIVLNDDLKTSFNFKCGPVLSEDTQGTLRPSSVSLNGNRIIIRGNRIVLLDNAQIKKFILPVPQQSCQLFKPDAGNETGNGHTRPDYTRDKLDLSRVENCNSLIKTQSDSHGKQNSIPSSTENSSKQKGNASVLGMKCHLKQEWKFNTGKCVDASPTIAVFEEKMLVFCGSHSGYFCAIDVKSAEVLWTANLPDRIESSACTTLDLRFVVVGCYDGGIYSLSTLSGNVEWCFKTQDIVKCSPMVDKSTGHVMCGSHDGNVYCLDIENKKCVWQKFLGGGGVLASPLIKADDNLAVVVSLRGKVWAVKCSDGADLWCTDMKKPIFSSPCLHGNSVLVGCTDNTLFCISGSGSIEWKFKTEGPIFSSPTSLGQSIIFGCHDCHIYCLTSSGQLKWSFKGKSTIFSTPFIFRSQKDVQQLEPNRTHKTCHCQNLPRGISSTGTRATNPTIENLSDTPVSFTSNHKPTHSKRPAERKVEPQSFLHDGSTSLHADALIFQEPSKKIAKYSISDNQSSASHIEQPSCPVTVTSCTYVKNNQLHSDTKNEAKLPCTCKTAASDSSTDKNIGIFNAITEENSFVKEEESMVVVIASSNGILYVVDVDSGRVVTEEALPGEVFSSPIVCDDKVVVGCRDNFLYCYEFVS